MRMVENLLDRNVNNFVQNLIHDPKNLMKEQLYKNPKIMTGSFKEIQKAYQIVK